MTAAEFDQVLVGLALYHLVHRRTGRTHQVSQLSLAERGRHGSLAGGVGLGELDQPPSSRLPRSDGVWWLPRLDSNQQPSG